MSGVRVWREPGTRVQGVGCAVSSAGHWSGGVPGSVVYLMI